MEFFHEMASLKNDHGDIGPVQSDSTNDIGGLSGIPTVYSVRHDLYHF